MQFLNEPVDVDSLPKAEDVILKPIEKDYLKVLRLEWLIVSSILLVIVAFLVVFIPYFQSSLRIVLISALWLLISIVYYTGQTKSFKLRGYAVRERDIIYRNGWIIRQIHICPFNRIQNSSVNTGPLERKYNLATLVLYTAGSNGADLHIRGLKEKEAHSIKDWITKKIGNEGQPAA